MIVKYLAYAMVRVNIKPELIQWAIDRSRRDPNFLSDKFDKIDDWQHGKVQPTLRQLEKFAAATRTPLGYFFLSEPPAEPLPIPDFRTFGSTEIRRPSPDLLETVYLCQQRQDWYRTNALMLREDPVGFIGAATLQSDPTGTANAIRDSIDFDLDSRAELATFEDALRMMIAAADGVGVLVMVSGIVGGNTQRPLDLGEFRGFALSDDVAPLIFINGADTKAGQMFTVAHELAHLWLGQSALTDATARTVAKGAVRSGSAIERWCNAVAAEVLVPLESFGVVYRRGESLASEMQRLARHYKVSTLVVLRRMFDAGGLSRDDFQAAFDAEVTHLRRVLAKKNETGGGGDFYATARTRLSPRFARAVLSATWEGRSSFTEAFRLLGCKNTKTLETLGDRLGMSDYLRAGAV